MRKLAEVIKEVENIEAGEENLIDSGIKDLVIGLRRWEIETEFSCEGHEDGLKYPWVDVNPNSIENLVKVLGIWWRNKEDSVPACDQPRWLIKSFSEIVMIFPEDKKIRSLEEMQEDAKSFGRFLQEIPDNFFEE